MKDGAHLAIINSEIEASNLALFLEIKSHLIEHVEEKESVFLGFHDLFEEGEFLTIFGMLFVKNISLKTISPKYDFCKNIYLRV